MNKLFTRTTIKSEHSIIARGAVVSGDTIAYKDVIKRFGGKWNAEAKGWQFENEEPAQWIVTCFNERKNKASNAKALDRKKAKADAARAEEKKLIALRGETFPIKAALEEKFGAKWGPYHRAMLVAPEVAEEAQEFVNFGGKTAEEVEQFDIEHSEIDIPGAPSMASVCKWRAVLREADIELKEQAVKKLDAIKTGRVRDKTAHEVRFVTSYFVESDLLEAAMTTIDMQQQQEDMEKRRREEAAAEAKAVFEAKLAAAKKPSEDQIAFIKQQLWKWKKDGWNYAVDVHEYRDISLEHRDYFSLIGWPWDLRGSAVRDWSGTI